MKFSIIVPIYNSEKYLKECIDSVLAQTFNDYELILVDDGSTDNSRDICDFYSKKYEKILSFHKSNSGQIATRCYGIEKSCGDFVIFLDSDDILSPKALQTINDVISKYSCDMLIYNMERFKDNVNFKEQSNIQINCIETRKELYKTILSDSIYNPLWIKAVRREFIPSKDYSSVYSLRHGEDLLQTLDIIKNNPKTVMTNEVLYYYRVNPNSVTHKLNIPIYVESITFVRNMVYQTLLREKIYNYEDYCVYCSRDIKSLTSVIAKITISNITINEKIKMYEKIKNTDYYRSFLSQHDYDKKMVGKCLIVWYLFKKGWYHLLIILYKIKTKMLKVKR